MDSTFAFLPMGKLVQVRVFAVVKARPSHLCYTLLFRSFLSASGKTYTMEGSNADPGVNFRALKYLFDSIAQKNAFTKTFDYKITLSCIEIYNEQPRDMLLDHNEITRYNCQPKNCCKRIS